MSNYNASLRTVDLITDRILARGGSAAYARKLLEDAEVRKSTDPIPYSAFVPHDPRFTPAVTLNKVMKKAALSEKKVTIVGCGQVGLAGVYALLNQGTADTIAMIDMAGEKLEGELKDLRQGSAFVNRHVRLEASTDYEISANSDLVIITAGAAQRPGESRLDLVGRNVPIMKSILSKVLSHSPNAPICIVSNPCDIMTAVAAKLAGPSVPPGQIFGSGTTLDSSRLKSLIGASLDVDAKDVNGYVIGEHGDSSVSAWSTVRVGGVPLLEPGEKPNEAHLAMHAEVFESAGDVIKKKGYTNWAVGLAIAHIAKTVLNDEKRLLPVSTCVRGFGDIKEDVFLSLPCVVGAAGVTRVVHLPLSDDEMELMRNSAEKVWSVQSGIWDKI